MVKYDIPFVDRYCIVGGVSSIVNNEKSFLLLLLICLGPMLKKVTYIIFLQFLDSTELWVDIG